MGNRVVLAVGIALLLLSGVVGLVLLNRGDDKSPVAITTLYAVNVDTSYANAGYLQQIVSLPSPAQRVTEMRRYYTLLAQQNRGVTQPFDPALASVLAIENVEDRQEAFGRWNFGPKGMFAGVVTIPILIDVRGDDEDYVREQGALVTETYDIIDAVAVSVTTAQYGQLTADSRVERVTLDVQAQATDAELDNSWGVKRVGSEANHTAGFRGAGVRIGIIDTGINRTHVDLAPNYDASCSYDFVNNDSDPMDDNGHGTHVSGTAAGADNNTGVVGMAPDATLCAYKVLAANGGGSYSSILAALDRAVDEVDVINMSLGSTYPGSIVEEAFANAQNAGLTMIAAAGNESPCGAAPPINNVGYPAAFSSVIAVAATDTADRRSCFSSVGPDVELAAPGSGIVSTWIGNNTAYTSASGTSMATPHVAGLVAVLFGCGANLTNDGVAQVLRNTARDLDSPLIAGVLDGRDTWFGYGLIQTSVAALSVDCQASGTPVPTPPSTATRTTTVVPNPTATRTRTPINPTATRTAIPITPVTAVPTRTPTLTRTSVPRSTGTPRITTPTRTRTATPIRTPTITRTPCPVRCATLRGDADGSGIVDVRDALLILQAEIGYVPVSVLYAQNADVNGDGRVNVIDATLILQQVVQ